MYLYCPVLWECPWSLESSTWCHTIQLSLSSEAFSTLLPNWVGWTPKTFQITLISMHLWMQCTRSSLIISQLNFKSLHALYSSSYLQRVEVTIDPELLTVVSEFQPNLFSILVPSNLVSPAMRFFNVPLGILWEPRGGYHMPPYWKTLK